MKLIEKLDEFKKELRDAIINKEIPISIIPETVSGYNGNMTVEFEGIRLSFAIANTFVCYLNPLTQDTFSKKDINILNKMIDEKFKPNSEKVSKIRELQAEINKLREEI